MTCPMFQTVIVRELGVTPGPCPVRTHVFTASPIGKFQSQAWPLTTDDLKDPASGAAGFSSTALNPFQGGVPILSSTKGK